MVSPQQLATHLGVTYQAIKKQLEGTSKSFSASNNELAAQFLGVTSRWLATGKGPRQPESTVIGLVRSEQPLAGYGPSQNPAWPFETVSQQDLASLTPEQRETLEAQILGIVSANAKRKPVSPQAV